MEEINGSGIVSIKLVDRNNNDKVILELDSFNLESDGTLGIRYIGKENEENLSGNPDISDKVWAEIMQVYSDFYCELITSKDFIDTIDHILKANNIDSENYKGV